MCVRTRIHPSLYRYNWLSSGSIFRQTSESDSTTQQKLAASISQVIIIIICADNNNNNNNCYRELCAPRNAFQSAGKNRDLRERESGVVCGFASGICRLIRVSSSENRCSASTTTSTARSFSRKALRWNWKTRPALASKGSA